MRLLIIFLLYTALSFAQNPYPQDYFQSPLDIPLHPSGTFGEVRTNHFHAGLDYRTQQKTGLPVHAAADGYVARIKVSTYGYGTALYVAHPNGYTTVYGHLSSYADKINDIVKARQYKKESFAIELFFKPNEIPVEQGEVIALSGNTGGSGGPHLHFEYRDSKTQKIINPLHFGLKKLMIDTNAPRVKGLMVYPLSDDGVVNVSKTPVLVNLKRQTDGTYLANKIFAKGKIGLSINTSDRSNGSSGNNGVYKVEMFSNDSLKFKYVFDTFSFSESRYANNFIDYSYYRTTKKRFQKLFIKRAYPLSIVKNNTSDGQFDITKGAEQDYKIEISDFHGNKTIVKGSIVYSANEAKDIKEIDSTSYFVKSRKDNFYTKNNISVFIPKNAFYEDFYMDFDVKDSVLYLHNNRVPVHKKIKISFNVDHLSSKVLQKTFIADIAGNSKGYNRSYIDKGRLTTKVRTLGEFKLSQDVTSPKIYAPSFTKGKWLTKQESFSVKISDDLSGIATFDAWLNGKWILMHYDYKTNIIFHNFSDNVVDEGRNDLKVRVTDNVGNVTVYESHFFRTQKTTSVENDKDK
ncbi:MAG: peptidase M23 [Flavobacterium sp. MedPE-SWcel]|uniref:M23 family metallopeptidase n=1 Tax=uncultured Flavobacterium sp. TaxID=165435 RepID=UPI00092164A8|nr:M23 family metallopeptidase [uncultured Flavobacterium sp.]OIQ22146.1 MAG: peptidase M23 [Flavobacterium sp. MedPE-SWcel]